LDDLIEKKERILQAAISEFAKGYRQASTDHIVEVSGVSKGLLFHYFTSKKLLYEACIKRVENAILDQIHRELDFSHMDFLTLLYEITLEKCEYIAAYPDHIRFLMNMYRSDEAEIQPYKQELLSTYAKAYDHVAFLKDADMSLFREDINLNDALLSIQYFVQGFAEAFLQRHEKQEMYLQARELIEAELKPLIQLMKKLYYKERREL